MSFPSSLSLLAPGAETPGEASADTPVAEAAAGAPEAEAEALAKAPEAEAVSFPSSLR